MAGHMNGSEDEIITGINVTPLVDVVLVLLIIFMITAPALYQSGIKVELPKAASGAKVERMTLKITLTATGEMRLGDSVVQMSDLTVRAGEALKKDPEANAIIAADRGLTHGQVIEVIDTLKTAGITRIALGTQSKRK